MQRIFGWLGNNALGMGAFGQGLRGPKTKCESSVFRQHQVKYGHHEEIAKEAQAIRCSPFLVGQESMLEEWVSWAKG